MIVDPPFGLIASRRKGHLMTRPRKPWTMHYNIHTIYSMADVRFAWDRRKNAANVRKHGVSFEEPSTMFLDDNALLIADPGHSEDEDRFVLLGLSVGLRVLVVCHCFREKDDVIRIISARKANRREESDYSQRRKR